MYGQGWGRQELGELGKSGRVELTPSTAHLRSEGMAYVPNLKWFVAL